jgi:hypothetical protein
VYRGKIYLEKEMDDIRKTSSLLSFFRDIINHQDVNVHTTFQTNDQLLKK